MEIEKARWPQVNLTQFRIGLAYLLDSLDALLLWKPTTDLGSRGANATNPAPAEFRSLCGRTSWEGAASFDWTYLALGVAVMTAGVAIGLVTGAVALGVAVKAAGVAVGLVTGALTLGVAVGTTAGVALALGVAAGVAVSLTAGVGEATTGVAGAAVFCPLMVARILSHSATLAGKCTSVEVKVAIQ